ncbi:hypothetical protein OSTOST_08819, partial [Ostertagia ostertagi]
MSKSAFVIGGTGAVGRQLIDALVSTHRFRRIVLIGRRRIPLDYDIIVSTNEQAVVDFDAIEKRADLFNDIDVGFCALGTTYAKSAGIAIYSRTVQMKSIRENESENSKISKERRPGMKGFVIESTPEKSQEEFYDEFLEREI